MHIPIWLLAIAGVIGFIFLTPYRQGLIDIFSVIWDLICGSASRLWDFIRGVAPSAGETGSILGRIGMVLMFITLAMILFIAFLYFVIGTAIMGIGIATGHVQAALWLLLALTIWGILSVFPSMRGFRTLNWISRWPVRLAVIALFIYLAVASIWWVFGNISPRLQGSLSRSGENTTAEFANKLDKGSMKSEPEMGVFAKVMEDSQIYNQPTGGLPTSFAKMGTLVMILVKENQLEGKRADVDSEGRTKVMLSDRYGDFNKGSEGWISTRKLDWNWQSKLQSEPRANVPAASAVPVEKWKLCWKKPEGYAGVSDLRSLCGITEIKKDKDNILATFYSENGPATFKGVSMDGKKYQGVWKDRFYSGEFFLDFLSEDSATGYTTDQGSTAKKDVLATKI